MMKTLFSLSIIIALVVQNQAQIISDDLFTRKALQQAFNLPDESPQTSIYEAITSDKIKGQQTSPIILTPPEIQYSKLKQLALKSNLPTKVVLQNNDQKLFLIINSNGKKISLLEIPQKAINKLFSSGNQFLSVDEKLLKDIPKRDTLNENARLIKLADGDISFLEAGEMKYPLYEQSFKNFGFSLDKVQEADEQYLINLRNQSPLF